MTRRNFGWFVAAAILALLVSASAPAFPKDAAVPGSSQTAGTVQPGGSRPAEKKDANQTVETILREQEQLLSGQRFSYDPGGRRDPFRSLFQNVPVVKGKGPRPKGVAGMLVAEVNLVGIVRDARGGNIAFFTGSDNKGYFLHVGDEVYDGTVIAVDPVHMTATFRQQVDDPRLIKPYRDVIKRLVPQEEEKAHE